MAFLSWAQIYTYWWDSGMLVAYSQRGSRGCISVGSLGLAWRGSQSATYGYETSCSPALGCVQLGYGSEP